MRRPLEPLGERMPGVDLASLRGKLIAIEGPTASGCSTQTLRLRDWLEEAGYAATVVSARDSETALTDSGAALVEFADLAAAIEKTIVPALASGFHVIADRYIFTRIARARARGVPRDWLVKLGSFALVPHATLYLRAAPDRLAQRAALRGGLSYRESAMDLGPASDRWSSFLRYQQRIISAYDGLTKDYGFITLDADREPDHVFRQVRRAVGKLQ